MNRWHACCWLAIVSPLAWGVEIGPSDDLEAAIAALAPGDVLNLRAGTYVYNSRLLVSPVGTAANPITVQSKPGEHAHVRQDNPNENIIDVVGTRFFVLRDIEFSGGSHGIHIESSNDLTIENCEVHDTGDAAITANSGGTYERLKIVRNHIHHTNGTGEGMYLGCNSDSCRVANSLIEWNYIHHTNGPNVEQGVGIELKEGSYGNVVRDNVIHDTNYPGIITYSTSGNGSPNVIEGNFIFRNNDHAIQSAADATIRNNVILGTIGLQSHQAGSPSNHRVTHNTIVGGSIQVRNVSGTVVIANNALYSQSGSGLELISGNLGLVTATGNVTNRGGQLATDFVNGNYSGVPPLDLFPRTVSALIGAGSTAYVDTLDFNGTPRNGAADVGAYAYSAGGNPGWPLAPGFKSAATGNTPRPPTNVQVR